MTTPEKLLFISVVLSNSAQFFYLSYFRSVVKRQDIVIAALRHEFSEFVHALKVAAEKKKNSGFIGNEKESDLKNGGHVQNRTFTDAQ